MFLPPGPAEWGVGHRVFVRDEVRGRAQGIAVLRSIGGAVDAGRARGELAPIIGDESRGIRARHIGRDDGSLEAFFCR